MVTLITPCSLSACIIDVVRLENNVYRQKVKQKCHLSCIILLNWPSHSHINSYPTLYGCKCNSSVFGCSSANWSDTNQQIFWRGNLWKTWWWRRHTGNSFHSTFYETVADEPVWNLPLLSEFQALYISIWQKLKQYPRALRSYLAATASLPHNRLVLM